MSDRDTLISLLVKMGLTRVEDRGRDLPHDAYEVMPDGSVIVGAGLEGYAGFYAAFRFDADGNILSHAILE